MINSKTRQSLLNAHRDMVKDELRGRTRVGDDDIEYSVRARDIEELHRLQTSSTTNLEGVYCGGSGLTEGECVYQTRAHQQTMSCKRSCSPSARVFATRSASMCVLVCVYAYD